MKSSKFTMQKWNAPIVCFIFFFVIIIILFIQYCYLALSKNVYGINMRKFAASRNTVTQVLTAKRGTIFDADGNPLAQNISTYTLIACLDPSRTVDDANPEHVVDKEYTATKLSNILGEDNYEYILERLNSSLKQVEFGTIGKNLTELTKLSIEELNLPGISFTETINRYYPNGDFASYIVGYAKQYTKINMKVDTTYDLNNYYKNYFNNYSGITIELEKEDIVSVNGTMITSLKSGKTIMYIKSYGQTIATILVNVTEYDVVEIVNTAIVGELGIESHFNNELDGIDGYIKYQQDKYGYKIPDTPEELLEAENGYDIYLTIDSNIQRFAENAINEIVDNYKPDWSVVAVMDAKTGEILASATSPSYNPNDLPNLMSYQNPLVSYTYEPGSVMKIYTYMCALETGNYDGEKKYLSGSYTFNDGTVIHDWNNYGWGYLTYDNGFSYSSNVAIINIMNDYLSSEKYKACLMKYGFGKKTGIELSNEESGKIDFLYDTEISAAGFGQGISTTPIQQLQALSIIANDGVMIYPHIISKVVNTKTGEEKITKTEKSDKLVSSTTISKIKDLMESVIQPNGPTGAKYYLEGYDIIGKTGTAQIFENGKYLKGYNDYIVSVSLMYPKNNPKYIIYAAAKKPTNTSMALPNAIKELVQNISKYKSVFEESKDTNKKSYISLESFINGDINIVKEKLNQKKLDAVVIGDGNKIIKQYPLKGETVVSGDKIFLLTNGTNISMPNITNWSRYDVSKFCEFSLMTCTFDGYGYVVSQSIEYNTILTDDSNLDVLLGNVRVN